MYSYETKKKVYGEIFSLAISPNILMDSHLMIEFEKETEVTEVTDKLKSQHKEFGQT